MENFLPALKFYGLAFAVCLLGLGILKFIGYKVKSLGPVPWYFFLIYALVMVPVQVFLFRAVLPNLLTTFIGSVVIVIILSSLIFATSHIIYKDYGFLLITFILGLILNTLYYYYPNFLLSWGVHALIGLCTFALGIL